MSWQVEYYKRITANACTRTLDSKIRAKAFLEIELLETHGFDLKEPYIKPLVGKHYQGIYELICPRPLVHHKS